MAPVCRWTDSWRRHQEGEGGRSPLRVLAATARRGRTEGEPGAWPPSPRPPGAVLLRRLVAVEDVGHRPPCPVRLTAVHHDVLARVLDRRPAGRRNGQRVMAAAVGQIAGARDGRGFELDAAEARVDQALQEALDAGAALDDGA